MVIHERYLTTWLVLHFKFCKALLSSSHTVEKNSTSLKAYF